MHPRFEWDKILNALHNNDQTLTDLDLRDRSALNDSELSSLIRALEGNSALRVLRVNVDDLSIINADRLSTMVSHN